MARGKRIAIFDAEVHHALQAATGPISSLVEREALIARKHEIERRWPIPRATFEDAFAHVLYAIRVAGIDHVGIGAD